MQKGMKKGQVSTTFMIFLVLGIVVLVFAVLWITGVGDYIFGQFDWLPDDLQSSVTACSTYADESLGLQLSYCKYVEGKRIEGKKQWVNCDGIYDAANRVLEDGAGFEKISGCKSPKTFCEELRKESGYKESIVVNGQECGDGWGVMKEIEVTE